MLYKHILLTDLLTYFCN